MFSKITGMSLLAVAGAKTFAAERDLSGYEFKHFMAEFDKTYTVNELAKREAIFEANKELIIKHNANADKTWYAAPNKFIDLTNDEFKKVYHGHVPFPEGTFPTANVEGIKVADSIDWRETDGVVTPVKDQGSCGSCWAFSTAETLESHLAITTGKAAPILSEQQLVSCAPNPDHCGGTGGCAGSIQTLGFNYSISAGITTEAAYPYTARTGTCDNSKIKPVAYNDGFVALTPNVYNDLIAAVNIGPVAISLAAGTIGWQLYGGGVYNADCGVTMDHAVQLVGYGEDNITGQMYWLVRNSWGARWGEKGYIRIARYGDGNEPCGVDTRPQDGEACEGDTTPRTYCGLCGIMGSSSYPTGLREA